MLFAQLFIAMSERMEFHTVILRECEARSFVRLIVKTYCNKAQNAVKNFKIRYFANAQYDGEGAKHSEESNSIIAAQMHWLLLFCLLYVTIKL